MFAFAVARRWTWTPHRHGLRSSRMDLRPLATPTLLWRPSSMLPFRLTLRPGVENGGFDELAECFGFGRRLLRRWVMALAGRAARRAAGLSSPLFMFSSTICTRRVEDAVPVESEEEPGVIWAPDLFLAGVEGDCMGLAKGRRRVCCPGVVDPGRMAGGGDRVEPRPRGLRTGMAE